MKTSIAIVIALLTFATAFPTLQVFFPFANVVNRVKNGQVLKIEIDDCHPGWGEGIFPINTEDLKYFRVLSDEDLETWGIEVATNDLIGGQSTCTFYFEPHRLGKEKIYFQYVNKGVVGELYSVSVKAIKGDDEESEPVGKNKDESYHYFNLTPANLEHRTSYDVKVGDIVSVDTLIWGSVGVNQQIDRENTSLTFISVLENNSGNLIGSKTINKNYFVVQEAGDQKITILNNPNNVIVNIHADE